MKIKKSQSSVPAALIITILFLATNYSNAQITQVENLFGKYALSVDGCENNLGSGEAGSCIIIINKPAGATLYKAYLVASQTPADSSDFPDSTPVRVNTANTYSGSIGPVLSTMASSVGTLTIDMHRTRYGNVTTSLEPLLNSLPAGASPLYLMPDSNQVNTSGWGLEGRTLLVIWNDPNGADKVISISLGSTTSLPPTTVTVNTPPLNITPVTSTAIAGLGINYSTAISVQKNNVTVNNTLITTEAGGYDDGTNMMNGELFTIGDDNDALGATTEKYNIKPALTDGSTTYTVTFQNVLDHSQDYLSVYYSVASGAFQTGAVNGILYSDANTNFLYNTGETGLPANITVDLYRDIDGVPGLNTTTDQLVATTVTDAAGQYSFPGVTVGSNYIVQVNLTDTDIPTGAIIETSNPVLNVAVSNADTTIVNVGFIPLCKPAVRTSDTVSICAGENYQLPSGVVVRTGGIYIDTVRTPLACDSIISTTHLIVHNNSASTVVDSIYEGQTYTLPSGTEVNAEGTYQSNLTNSNGCDSTVTTVLRFRKPDCLVLTNAFTPNGDGVNDYWILYRSDCFRKLRVSVYNRYGSLVYQSGDYKNNWNGKYNGKDLPDATYYYVIKVIYYNGREHALRGDVTILR